MQLGSVSQPVRHHLREAPRGAKRPVTRPPGRTRASVVRPPTRTHTVWSDGRQHRLTPPIRPARRHAGQPPTAPRAGVALRSAAGRSTISSAALKALAPAAPAHCFVARAPRPPRPRRKVWSEGRRAAFCPRGASRNARFPSWEQARTGAPDRGCAAFVFGPSGSGGTWRPASAIRGDPWRGSSLTRGYPEIGTELGRHHAPRMPGAALRPPLPTWCGTGPTSYRRRDVAGLPRRPGRSLPARRRRSRIRPSAAR
jgi:hypothetical protein